jgi:colanic acid/amylovoran biosynthesis glycosyltransferase
MGNRRYLLRDHGDAADGSLGNEVKRETVLIYRDRLLPYSETFIPAQVNALGRYRAHYVGMSQDPKGCAAIAKDQFSLLERHVRWPQVSKTAFRLSGWMPLSFRRSLQGRSPRLIHAHFGPDGVFARAIAHQLRIPLVVTFHGYDAALKLAPEDLIGPNPVAQAQQFLCHRGTFYKRRYVEQRQQLFAQAAQVIAVSHCIREHLLTQGCPEAKIKVHYIGIDRSQFAPDPAIQRQPIVLFVGRLVEKKGCAQLLKAMVDVQKLHPEVRTVIIGDGPLRSPLENQARQRLERVEFLGVQPAPVVRQWMNRAQVFCVPSQRTAQQDVEGLGMVFAEAQAMGLPVVSFAAGGVPEVVDHGVTGLLVPEGDYQGLAQALDQLLQDPALRERFAIAGQRHVAQTFDIAKNTPPLEALYDSLWRSP